MRAASSVPVGVMLTSVTRASSLLVCVCTRPSTRMRCTTRVIVDSLNTAWVASSDTLIVPCMRNSSSTRRPGRSVCSFFSTFSTSLSYSAWKRASQ